MADILMLVRNNCRNDVRVLKEAVTLKRAGHEVRILAVTDTTCTQLREEVLGMRVYRIRVYSPVPEFLRWLRGRSLRSSGSDMVRALLWVPAALRRLAVGVPGVLLKALVWRFFRRPSPAGPQPAGRLRRVLRAWRRWRQRLSQKAVAGLRRAGLRTARWASRAGWLARGAGRGARRRLRRWRRVFVRRTAPVWRPARRRLARAFRKLSRDLRRVTRLLKARLGASRKWARGRVVLPLVRLLRAVRRASRRRLRRVLQAAWRWCRRRTRGVVGWLRRGGRRVSRRIRVAFRLTTRYGFIAIRAVLRPLARPLLSLSYYAASSLWALKHPAGIYHCHDLNTLWVGYLMARLTRSRFVYDSHELNLDRAMLQRRPLEQACGRLWERFLVRRCDAVIVAGDMAADVLSARYHIARPTVIMNLANATAVNTPDIWRPEHERAFSDTRFKLLYLGGLTWFRGLEQTLEALAALDDGILFVVMGPVNARFAPELLKRARELGVESRLSLLDPVPFTEVARYTPRADAGIVPVQNRSLNNYYCLPNKLFQYIVSGLPVLASNFPELRRFVEGCGIGRLFDPASPADIAAAIRQARDEPAVLAEWRAGARRLALTLNWEAQESKLLEVYQQLKPRYRRASAVVVDAGGEHRAGVEER